MSIAFMRSASLLAVIAAIGTGAYVLGQHDGKIGVSFWSTSTAKAQQVAKSVPSPVKPLAEQDVMGRLSASVFMNGCVIRLGLGSAPDTAS